jgi:hypothetical protein
MRQKKLFNAVVIILHEAFTVPPLNPFYGYPVFSPLARSYFFASHSYSTHISVQALGIAAFITDSQLVLFYNAFRLQRLCLSRASLCENSKAYQTHSELLSLLCAMSGVQLVCSTVSSNCSLYDCKQLRLVLTSPSSLRPISLRKQISQVVIIVSNFNTIMSL